MQLTLAWGRLVPFPTNAKNVSIQIEGNRFARSFRAQFNAPNQDIETWIDASPGLKQAKIEAMTDETVKYVISPGDGANYAEVIVDFGSGKVEVYVSWMYKDSIPKTTCRSPTRIIYSRLAQGFF